MNRWYAPRYSPVPADTSSCSTEVASSLRSDSSSGAEAMAVRRSPNTARSPPANICGLVDRVDVNARVRTAHIDGVVAARTRGVVALSPHLHLVLRRDLATE